MKTNRSLLMMVTAAFVLGACSDHVSAASPSAEELISGAYTAVALTGLARPEPTQTAATMPTVTFTAIPTAQPTLPPSAISMPTANSPARHLEISYPEPQLAISATSSLPASMQSGGVTDGSSTAAIALCDGSAYLDDVNVPDGTVFEPGKVFTKTWKLQNTGTSTWNKFYAIAFSGGASMGGTTTTLRRAIPPNGTGNVSVELTAPNTAGSYTGYWIMTNSSGTAFGNILNVQIVVRPNESSEDE